MGCGCNGTATSTNKASWTVNLAGTGRVFADGTSSRTYALPSEANSAIAQLGLTGVVVPKATVA